jgi:predicted ATPase
MDFGIARSMASRLTAEGEITGTVFYLAPEIALGQEFDGRADLYSLGVMLYELATGALPFVHGDPLAVVSQHLHASVVPPRAKDSQIPPRLDRLILQLLSKSPENRPATAAEVRRLLERKDLLDLEAEEIREFAVLRRIARGRFVGREQELTEAKALWNKALEGEGQTLLISGAPGVGKSRFVRELATQVEVSGGTALVGECEAEGGAPYAPFAQVLRRALRQGDHDSLALPEFVLSDLLKLAPELTPYYPDIPENPALEPEAERQRLFDSVAGFCQILSERRPLLLLLDDAHWADSGSLALLRYLARRTRRQRTMLVATYRELELDEGRPFHETLLELNRQRLGRGLKLKPLSKPRTRDLLAAIFEDEITPEFLDGIYHVTEGNPFFIEEVCKALVEDGRVYYENGRWHRPSMEELEIPRSVRLAIQSRLSKLPDECRQTLSLAAVIGREFDFDTLAAASDLDEETLISALEAAAQAQLVQEVGAAGGVTFSFVHALVSATVKEGVQTLRRRKLHRQVAAAIESLHPEDSEALAYHYGEAGDEGRALTHYILAGRHSAAGYAHREAESHFRRALELHPSPADEAELLTELGRSSPGKGALKRQLRPGSRRSRGTEPSATPRP